jgi:hypothetical protein
MATVYNWVISQMEEKPQEGSMLDVVTVIHWRRELNADIDGESYFTSTYGAYNCPTPSETDFTAYPDLTFEQVCGWLDAGAGVDEIDAALLVNVEKQINPPSVNLPFPWLPVPPTPDTSGTSGSSGTSGTSGTDGTSGTSGI